jgi:hypothetical protein
MYILVSIHALVHTRFAHTHCSSTTSKPTSKSRNHDTYNTKQTYKHTHVLKRYDLDHGPAHVSTQTTRKPRHTHTLTNTHTHTQTHTHTNMNMNTGNRGRNVAIRSPARPRISGRKQQEHLETHTRTQTQTHTYIHSHKHTHKHTNTGNRGRNVAIRSPARPCISGRKQQELQSGCLEW